MSVENSAACAATQSSEDKTTLPECLTPTTRKRRKLDESNSQDETHDQSQENDNENDVTLSSESESESDSDIEDHDTNSDNIQNTEQRFVGIQPNSGQSRGKVPPRMPNIILHDFRFPVILEDTGRPGLNSEQLVKYDFDLNRLMNIAQVGKIKTAKKISNKKYIVECNSNKQRDCILKLVQLRTPSGGYIAINAHIPEPTTEGVIGPINKFISNDDIQEKIDEYNRVNTKLPVSKFERVIKYNGGRPEMTAYIRLSFRCSTLPTAIKLGCTFYPIEPYRREPLLCTKCYRLGHTKSKCRKGHEICGKCLGAKHEFGEKECPIEKSKWFCVNCNVKGHSASWPRCPSRIRLREALSLQAQHYMPLAAALAQVDGKTKPTSGDKANKKAPQRNQSQNVHISALSVSKGGKAAAGTWGTRRGAWPAVSDFPQERSAAGPTEKEDSSSAAADLTGGQKSQDSPNCAGLASDNLASVLDAINKSNLDMQKRIDVAMATMHKDTKEKIDKLTKKLDDLCSQKEEQLRMMKEFVKLRKQKANSCEKAALDIVDIIRQATEGNPEGIFAMAKKLSKTNEEISQNMKTEIATLTQNLGFSV